VTRRDAAARSRAESDARSSLLVEASAGTGKTTTLIRRMVHLVVEEGVPLREIAAMTFTEKAAGEMKTRLRKELDDVLATGLEGEKKDRALRAILDLDAAEISTIHSFCARLLRERPVEAEVDPDFVAGDELLAADLADEAWREWFDRAARRDPGPVADVLRLGVSPDRLKALALDLYEERLPLADATLPADSGEQIRDAVRRLLSTYEPLSGLLSSKDERKKRDRVEGVLLELRKLLELPDDRLGAATPDLKIALRGNWPVEVKEAIESSRDELAVLEDLLAALPLVPKLTALVEEIRSSFFSGIEAAKRRDGLLDFDDLLLRARDLLRDSRAAREHFHSKYRTLVVDEFQDTDPVQAEIVMRLAAPPGGQDGPWTDLTPEPGRLFLVGDPKQSIYRFRRADIETYAEAGSRFSGSDRLSLSSSFRSTKPLLDFVNEIGPALLPPPGERRFAVGYSPLDPSEKTKPGDGPAVLFLSPPEPEAEAPDDSDDLPVRRQEARAIANLLLDRYSRDERRWSAIAVLVPRNDTVPLLEDALRAVGIPFVLEGGKSFYKRDEVAAAVQALRAIDDPSNGIAVVAALKSVLFGVSDRLLLDAAEAGARFDDPATLEESSPLFPAIRLLHRLHRGRHARPFAATLADLLASRQALASIENGAVVHPVQGLANLERLLAFARDLDRQGLTFRESVDRIVRQTEGDAAEPAAFTEESDAVRLMTLHKAKGLEFDVVVLADFGLKRLNGGGEPPAILWERAGGLFGVRLKFGDRVVRSARFAEVEAADAIRREAEVRRLLYVGFTRARESLVVSWFRKWRFKKDGDPTDLLPESLLGSIARLETPTGRLADLVEVVRADVNAPAPRAAPAERTEPVDIAAEMATAEVRLERTRKTASRPLRRAGEKAPALPFVHEDAEPSDRDEAPDRARRIGVAVHSAMEALLRMPKAPDVATAKREIRKATETLFEDERLETARLVEELLSKDVVSRAFAVRRRFVELPLLYVDDTLPERPLVEGKLDLLFEEADGWQIVDWKTDRVDSTEDRLAREALYAPQLRAYEDGLRKLLGPDAVVKRGVLVFARALRA
jgi:ATP-dependent exoDNAse (exonuclease V) beta subunit